MLTSPISQRGMALMEVLAALLVLALGIGGLAWAQGRMLVDGRAALARASAITLAADLGNRMMFNRDAAQAGRYAMAWDETPAALDCGAGCTAEDLARSDLAQWRDNVGTALPRGNASVFRMPSDARQFGIAIAWSTGSDTSDDASYLVLAALSAVPGLTCPAGQLCHVAYVQP